MFTAGTLTGGAKVAVTQRLANSPDRHLPAEVSQASCDVSKFPLSFSCFTEKLLVDCLKIAQNFIGSTKVIG